MMFLRYESFKDYVRYYPVSTILLAIIIVVHFGFMLFAAIQGTPANQLKWVYGGFIKANRFEPEFWRYVTSIFIHGHFAHLLFNAFSLYVFAPPLERALGRFRYIFLFLFAGVVGNIFTSLFMNQIFSVGASGSIYGIFGAYFYYMIFRRRSIDEASRRTLQMLLLIGIIFSVIMPNINFYAHLGGLVGGFVLNLLYSKFLQGRYT